MYYLGLGLSRNNDHLCGDMTAPSYIVLAHLSIQIDRENILDLSLYLTRSEFDFIALSYIGFFKSLSHNFIVYLEVQGVVLSESPKSPIRF